MFVLIKQSLGSFLSFVLHDLRVVAFHVCKMCLIFFEIIDKPLKNTDSLNIAFFLERKSFFLEDIPCFSYKLTSFQSSIILMSIIADACKHTVNCRVKWYLCRNCSNGSSGFQFSRRVRSSLTIKCFSNTYGI